MPTRRPRGFGGVFEEKIKGRGLVSHVSYEVEAPDRVMFDSPVGGFSEIPGEFNRSQVYCLGNGFRTR